MYSKPDGHQLHVAGALLPGPISYVEGIRLANRVMLFLSSMQALFCSMDACRKLRKVAKERSKRSRTHNVVVHHAATRPFPSGIAKLLPIKLGSQFLEVAWPARSAHQLSESGSGSRL